jgi:hypothetical protein
MEVSVNNLVTMQVLEALSNFQDLHSIVNFGITLSPKELTNLRRCTDAL